MAETLTIQVDDTDPGISYTGDWIADKGSIDNLGHFGAPVMSTSHYIEGKGSFSFKFSGTYVGVFGSSVDGSNPSRVCTVDGATIPNNVITAPVNGVMHCQVFNLPDGNHTLEVTVPTANRNGYWFDSLLYIPSASVSRADAMLMVRFDDPSFSFGAGWAQTGPGMLTTTNNASMSFRFTGRVATWFGYFQEGETSSATTGTYTIDGGSPLSFDLKAIQTPLVGLDSNERFFTTGLLPQGSHTVTVSYNGNNNTTPLAIYSFIVQSGTSADVSIGGAIGASFPAGSEPSSIPPSQQSESTVVVGTGTAAITITVVGSNPNPSSTITSGSPTPTTSSSIPISSDSNSGSSGKSNNHLGAVLGAVIGVLALLFLLLLAFVLYRRSRKRRGPDSNNNDTGFEPFTDPPRMSEIPAAVDSSTPSGGNSASFSNNRFYSDFKQPLPSAAVASPTRSSAASPSQQSRDGLSGSISQSSRSQLPTPSSPPAAKTVTTDSEVVVLHEDSGVRLPMGAAEQPGVTVVDMPPTYSAT